MTKNKFYSAYNLPVVPPRKGVFARRSPRFREDFSHGYPHLVVDGSDPLFDLIQAAAPGQEIYNIIDRYASIDDLINDLPSGSLFGDAERLPSELRDAYQLLHGLRDRFDDVAADKFNGTFGDFLEAVENNRLDFLFNEQPKAAQEEVKDESESK